MEVTLEQKESIVQLFKLMESKEEFLEILNIGKRIYYGQKTIPFELKQLNYYINKSNLEPYSTKDFFYETFYIPKKSGGTRTIHAPKKGLKELQNALNILIQIIYKPHPAATGFILGKSIVDNARPHVNQNYVYNLDLKDFFPSVHKARIWGRLLISPFNLNTSENRKKIANMIATLCCIMIKEEKIIDGKSLGIYNTYVLPQGAPTSPIISNTICEKLDRRLSGVAKRFGLNYSRYADDITFSSKHNTFELRKGIFENIYTSGSTFDIEIRRIIVDQNFEINQKKVRLQKQGFRQEVTGLSVNQKINVNRKYINLLRKWIYLWETYGESKASEIFFKQYNPKKTKSKGNQGSMKNIIEGKLLYLKMVKGEKDDNYNKLKCKFDKLIKKDDFIDNILKLWEDQGIDTAMSFYYSEE